MINKNSKNDNEKLLSNPNIVVSSGSGSHLSDYDERLSIYNDHKTAGDTVASIYQTNFRFKQYSKRMFNCAEFLRFHYQENIDLETGEYERKFALKNASFCRVRHCPVCQWRRSLMWRARLFNAFPEVIEKNENLELIFLTLTVKNCDVTDLRATLKRMNSGFNRMKLLKEWKPILGYYRATEITRNEKTGAAHPHFHCLIAVNKTYFKKHYISQERWTQMWRESARLDYQPVIDVRKVRINNKDRANSLRKGILEVTKYTTKIKDLVTDKDFLLEMTIQLMNLRFINCGGLFKSVLKKETNVELISGTDVNVDKTDDSSPEYLFKWYEKDYLRCNVKR